MASKSEMLALSIKAPWLDLIRKRHCSLFSSNANADLEDIGVPLIAILPSNTVSPVAAETTATA